MRFTTHSNGIHTYLITEQTPSVLLLSGMHGDESGSIDLLRSSLESIQSNAHGIVYIPYVSPSAFQLGTRKNKQHHDINRVFREATDDREALSVMSIVSPYRFSIAIDVHEDPDRTKAFYIYDTERMSYNDLVRYRQTVQTTDARLYTGIDDLKDENLGCHIDLGYYSYRAPDGVDTDKEAGFFSKWAIRNHKVGRVFTLEIPGKAKPDSKLQLIEAVVPFLIESFDV